MYLPWVKREQNANRILILSENRLAQPKQTLWEFHHQNWLRFCSRNNTEHRQRSLGVFNKYFPKSLSELQSSLQTCHLVKSWLLVQKLDRSVASFRQGPVATFSKSQTDILVAMISDSATQHYEKNLLEDGGKIVLLEMARGYTIMATLRNPSLKGVSFKLSVSQICFVAAEPLILGTGRKSGTSLYRGGCW